MITAQNIKIGSKNIKAVLIPLAQKNLIVLRGSKGYVMCGYLNLKVAEKFKDAAVKIVGVTSIAEALKANVFACSPCARRLGISKGQKIKDVLRIIA